MLLAYCTGHQLHVVPCDRILLCLRPHFFNPSICQGIWTISYTSNSYNNGWMPKSMPHGKKTEQPMYNSAVYMYVHLPVCRCCDETPEDQLREAHDFRGFSHSVLLLLGLWQGRPSWQRHMIHFMVVQEAKRTRRRGQDPHIPFLQGHTPSDLASSTWALRPKGSTASKHHKHL